MIKVSICVPVYGVEKYIERCAVSLFEQTYKDLEYVFVDDCTKDNSIQVLKSLLERYPHRKKQVRIIKHEYNKGLAGARNTAVAEATGDYIMHVDSDDWLELNAVDRCIEELKNDDFDMVNFCMMVHMKGYISVGKLPECKSAKEMTLLTLSRQCSVCVCGRLIRRELYINNNIQAVEGVNMGEDYQVSPRLLYFANKVSNINDKLYHYDFTNVNSYSGTFSEEKSRQGLEAYNVLESFFTLIEDKSYLYALREAKVKLIYRRIVNSITNKSFTYASRMQQLITEEDKVYIDVLPFSKRLVFYITNIPVLYIFCVTGKIISYMLSKIKIHVLHKYPTFE